MCARRPFERSLVSGIPEVLRESNAGTPPNVVQQIRGSKPVLASPVDRGRLRAVGDVYALDTGKVEWLPESPAKAMARLEVLRESFNV